jgi:hypothetical protein
MHMTPLEGCSSFPLHGVLNKAQESALRAIGELGALVPRADFDPYTAMQQLVSGGIVVHEYWVIQLIAIAEAAIQ